MRTEHERDELSKIAKQTARLRAMLDETPHPSADESAAVWHNFLGAIQDILGNFSNRRSFVACLLAKEYLERELPMRPFDVALKPQGANGHDVDERTTDGRRIVGEIKTTVPHLQTRFGAAQDREIMKDLNKLASAEAECKFFFVTNQAAANALRLPKYAEHLQRIKVVCLAS